MATTKLRETHDYMTLSVLFSETFKFNFTASRRGFKLSCSGTRAELDTVSNEHFDPALKVFIKFMEEDGQGTYGDKMSMLAEGLKFATTYKDMPRVIANLRGEKPAANPKAVTATPIAVNSMVNEVMNNGVAQTAAQVNRFIAIDGLVLAKVKQGFCFTYKDRTHWVQDAKSIKDLTIGQWAAIGRDFAASL